MTAPLNPEILAAAAAAAFARCAQKAATPAPAKKATPKALPLSLKRKQNVGPGQWSYDTKGRLAIYPQLAGVEDYDKERDEFALNMHLRGVYGTISGISKRQRLIELYNAGHRFVAPDPAL